MDDQWRGAAAIGESQRLTKGAAGYDDGIRRDEPARGGIRPPRQRAGQWALAYRAPPRADAGMRDDDHGCRPGDIRGQGRRVELDRAGIHALRQISETLRCGAPLAGPLGQPIQRQAGFDVFQARNTAHRRQAGGSRRRAHSGEHHLRTLGQKSRSEFQRIAPHAADCVGGQQNAQAVCHPACSNSRSGNGRCSWISLNSVNWPR
jgi:hypothetical protein